ncbi:TIGR02265 family protein [Archangium violaceum]|uniref:TIGR02265 family protein n=1 Tax=Archangium violaceum TaxID=83451 RepID=UPI0036D8F633
MASNQDAVELGSPRELELRLTLIPLGDTVRGYFFNCALEQVRLQGDEEALRRCIEASGLESCTAFFKYPMSALLQLLYHVSWALKDSSGSFEASMRQLGQWTAKEFLVGSVGRTMLLLAGSNLKRLADSLPTAYRTGWEHGWGEVAWTGSRQCLVSIHGNVVPYPYFEGVFVEVFQAAGASNLKVKGWQVGTADTRYSLSWG